MRQGKDAKTAWRNVPKIKGTIFPFESFPPLLEFLKRNLPKGSHIALIGGGKGYLAPLLVNGERTFVTVDIARIEDPAIPLIVADFEEPLPVLRQPNRELSALATFSLEYGDIFLATKNIAEALHSGERFIFVFHHSDSPFLVSMKADKEMFELINAAIKGIASASREEWLWRCKGLEPQMRKMFADRGESQKFPDFDPISECDERTFMRYQIFQRETEPPLSIGLLAVLTLRLGYQNPHLLNNVLGSFAPSWEALKEAVDFAAPLLEKNIQNPQDVASLVDSRFRVTDGVGIGAREGDSSKTDIVCFALAFQKK